MVETKCCIPVVDANGATSTAKLELVADTKIYREPAHPVIELRFGDHVVRVHEDALVQAMAVLTTARQGGRRPLPGPGA